MRTALTNGIRVGARTDVEESDAARGDGALSRRAWLEGAALVVSVGSICMIPTSAGAKTSQAEAKYQNQPKGTSALCGACQYFRPPSACQVVDGTISPQGWCPLFEKKSS